ncbi:MAG TPA: hypothetical protein VGN02_06620 [Paenibacillus sp.]
MNAYEWKPPIYRRIVCNQLLSPIMQGKSGIGVANTPRRLNPLYSQGLSISSMPGEGTTVSFIIPNHRNR